jgi:hypothetical protein
LINIEILYEKISSNPNLYIFCADIPAKFDT